MRDDSGLQKAARLDDLVSLGFADAFQNGVLDKLALSFALFAKASFRLTSSSREKSRRRGIGAYAGYRDVVLRASRVEVSAENVDALRALDLLTAVDPSSIDDDGRARLAAFLSRASVELLRANVRHFPAKTSKRLLEAEALGLLG